MHKKYKLREDDTIVREGRTLYRIEALRNVGFDVQEGDVGGYVEKEANLSQEGSCWLYQEACAYEDAHVEEKAMLYGRSTVRGKARLSGEAHLLDRAIVEGEAIVGSSVRLLGHVVVGGRAEVQGRVILYAFVHVGESARVQGDAKRFLRIQGTTMIVGSAVMQGYGIFPEEEAILEAGNFQVEEED